MSVVSGKQTLERFHARDMQPAYEPVAGAMHAGKTVRRRFTDLYRKVRGKWLLSLRQATISGHPADLATRDDWCELRRFGSGPGVTANAMSASGKKRNVR